MRFLDVFRSLSSRLSRVDRTILLGGGVLVAGVTGGAPGTALAQDPEEATADTTWVAEPPCGEPSPCPAPDSTKNSDATCYEPHSFPINKDVTLHIYGQASGEKGRTAQALNLPGQ